MWQQGIRILPSRTSEITCLLLPVQDSDQACEFYSRLKFINTISKEEENRKYICPAKARKMHHSNARNIEDYVKHSSPKTKVEETWLNEAIQHYIHTCIYTFIHTYTHTHIHIHVHTYNDNERKRLGLRNSTPSLPVTKSYLFFLQTSLKIFPPP